MILFTINQTTAPTRRETRNGREFLVVPVVALREGVLNDELMLAEEFSHGFEAWNGRAVTIGHPELDGENVSANTPGMLDAIAVGQLFNTGIKGDIMISEMWIDLSKVPLVDGGAQAVKRFESATLTDVSTAYLRDLEEKPGTFKGEAHNGIQRNIKPDHLAILLDEEGACSIADGCGAPRINKDGCEAQADTETPTQAQNEKWIIRQLKRLAARYNYRLEANMSREELMRHLSTMEGNIFNDEDMAEMSQSALEKLAALLQANQPPPDEEEPPEDETPGRTPEEEEMEALKLNQDGDEQTPRADPIIQALSEKVDGLIVQAQANAAVLQANADSEKAPLVEAVVANSTMTAEQISGFDLPTLKALRLSIVPADYSGQGGGPQAESGEQTYTI